MPPNTSRATASTRLRELTLVEISDPRSQQGTHLYDSLGLLFHLVDQGHTAPKLTGPDGSQSTDGLDFQPLRADLFTPCRQSPSSMRSSSATPPCSRCSATCY